MVKTTAVLSCDKQDFVIWCRERGIAQKRNGIWIDDENEEYTFVSRRDQVYGLEFNDMEETERSVMKREYSYLKQLIKSRIR